MEIIRQKKYRLNRFITREDLRVLEVVIGNSSPRVFKKYYPECIMYHGIDRDLNYNLDDRSIKAIDQFYQMDIETDSLKLIPEDYYDYVLIAHVIEHIDNGEEVINEIAGKLDKSGIIYIEYPHKESKKFPSMNGTLNFYDNPTYKRFYENKTLIQILKSKNSTILHAGVKRDFSRIIGIPFLIIKSIVVHGYIRRGVFWDILGFANFILAKKMNSRD